MNEEKNTVSALLDSGLEESLTETARTEWNATLRNDPEALAEYCRQMRIHALLKWKHGCALEPDPAAVEKPRVIVLPRWRWLGAAAAALVMAVGALVFFSPQSADAAASALERMIAVAARGGDRSYQLKLLAGEASFQLINGQRASCEGALMHLGRGGQFVYECGLSDGSRRITGSDGRTSWDILGSAPVHLSNDAARFRHHLPGQQVDFTYLDPGAQLALLREGYDMTLIPGNDNLKKLKAVKRSREFRGPREALINYEDKTATIRSIELYGLPQARGGPSALRLTLISQTPFPAGYFEHTAHHELGRRVEMEPDAPPPPRR